MDGKCPDHGTEPEWLEEKNWFFRLSAYQDRLLELYDERPDFVLPQLPLQRGAQLHRRRAARLLDQPRDADVGRSDSVGSGAGRVRLGGRARQLPQRAELRAGREPRAFLAGRALPREGHPSLPLCLLAGAAALRGRGAAEAALRARVPQLRRSQDVEVARQRHQSARAGRRLRRRRRALLRRARDDVRPGRQRLGRRRPRALRARARERPRQPRLADDGDDRALPRRRRSSRPTPTAPWDADAPARDARRRARPVRHHGRARGDLAARPPPQPVRRGVGAVAARQGRGARRRARRPCSTTSPTA